ncbi:MAG: hypothetical protein ACSHXL_02550 [Bacteroidota bacterium]
MNFCEWFMDALPFPKGVRLKAESSYSNEFDDSIFFKRNLLLDFAECFDKNFSKVDFANPFSKSSNMDLILKWFYLDSLESNLNICLDDSPLSGDVGENVVLMYGNDITGVMRVKADENCETVFHVDFAFTQRIPKENKLA